MPVWENGPRNDYAFDCNCDEPDPQDCRCFDEEEPDVYHRVQEMEEGNV